MTTNSDTYAQELLLELRLRDLPGPQIAEVLAEVDSHLAETNEHPVDAFGSPRAYADEVATAHGRRPGRAAWLYTLGWTDALIGVGSLAGGWLVADGLYRMGAATSGPLGLGGGVMAVLGLAVWVVVAAGLAVAQRGTGDRVMDPRTGADMARPPSRWATSVLVGAPCASLVAIYLLGLSQR